MVVAWSSNEIMSSGSIWSNITSLRGVYKCLRNMIKVELDNYS